MKDAFKKGFGETLGSLCGMGTFVALGIFVLGAYGEHQKSKKKDEPKKEEPKEDDDFLE